MKVSERGPCDASMWAYVVGIIAARGGFTQTVPILLPPTQQSNSTKPSLHFSGFPSYRLTLPSAFLGVLLYARSYIFRCGELVASPRFETHSQLQPTSRDPTFCATDVALVVDEQPQLLLRALPLLRYCFESFFGREASSMVSSCVAELKLARCWLRSTLPIEGCFMSKTSLKDLW